MQSKLSTSGSRILEIDSLRGLLIVLMATIHFPGIVGNWVTEAFGFIGPSEGFVFISGLMSGLICIRRYSQATSFIKAKWFFTRAIRLFVIQISMVFLLLLLRRICPELTSSWSEFGLRDHEPLRSAFASTVLLLFQPRYLDILPLFFGFLLIAPFALQNFSDNKYFRVIVVSFIFWAISQCYNIEDFTSSISLSSHLLLINQSPFTFFAWQLVFILGLFVGERIANRKSLPVLSNRMQLIPLLIVVVGTCWSHGILQMSLPQNLLLFLINKSTEGVFRIFELVSFVYLIHFAVTKFPKIFRTKWLIFIGQNSLAFYVTHIFVLYLLAPLRNTWHLEWTRWVQISATFVVILILTFSVWSFSVLRKLRYSFNKPINGNN